MKQLDGSRANPSTRLQPPGGKPEMINSNLHHNTRISKHEEGDEDSREGSETGGEEKYLNSVEIIFSRIMLPMEGTRLK